MSTMNVSLPQALRSFVDEQVARRNHASSSEYVRMLIRKDQDRQQFRQLLLDGGASRKARPADEDYFDSLRERAHHEPGG